MESAISVSDKKKCSGCYACINICPIDAVRMEKDQEGFFYPNVDKMKCLNCGKCVSVCPYNGKWEPETDLEVCYAAYNKDEKIRLISSSGGIFALLAKETIDNGGIVFGAAYDDGFLVYHKGIEKKEGILQLIGSKYLQSRIGYCYRQTKDRLLSGQKVLFVGTPCQIGGLKKYLGKEYDNLICVDFICLGVPSPQIWKDYLNVFFENETITHINFKDKVLGWDNFSLTIEGSRRYTKAGRNTYFFTGYFKGLYSRPSCSECIFKEGNRVSDITISDCWGYSHIAPELKDNKGLSSIICHSMKGMEMIEKIKPHMCWKKAEAADVKKYNSNYCTSQFMGKKREAFWTDYDRMGKSWLFKKYCTPEDNKYLKKIFILGKQNLKKLMRLGSK